MGAEIRNLSSEFGSDDERDVNRIDTIVVHSMNNPLSDTPYEATSCKDILDQYEVSSHYIIDREGTIWQLVPHNKMAWHAGKSQMPSPDGREKVNAFSLGIEVVGDENLVFLDAQYKSLAQLSAQLMREHNITNIVGHKDIAPERKTDPWNMDWKRFEGELSKLVDTDELSMFGPQNSGN